METRDWLAQSLNIEDGRKSIEQLYKNPIGLDFLLVWTIFETINFNGYMNINEIEVFSNNSIIILDIEMNEIFIKFYNRYKENENLLKNLCSKTNCKCSRKNCEIKKILGKSELSERENIFFDICSI